MLYDIGFAVFALFYLPTLIFKGKLHGDFLERFGVYSGDKLRALEAASRPIWIQAVSVGEVALCKSLIPKLKAAFPQKQIVLSTITKTGNDFAKKLFANDVIVMYFPLDFSFIVKKVVGLINPTIYVMIETEIWPNFLKEVSARSIPSIIINGRISDRSFGKYMMAKSFLKDTLSRISSFCMQSRLDAERIISMGAPKDKVSVTGNMKLDAEEKLEFKTREELSKILNIEPYDQIFVAGSTHKGEEEIVLKSFKELTADLPGLRLIIAPRHVERAGEVESVAKGLGFETVQLSKMDPEVRFKAKTPVFILDKIGYLNSAYSFASVVFIGGSLVKHGGQNPVEPAVLKKPIVFGPYMFNFKDISNSLLEGKAAIMVRNKIELTGHVKELLGNKATRDELGDKALKVVINSRGATAKNLKEIERLIRGA